MKVLHSLKPKHYLLRQVSNINTVTTRSAVDLAHKIHGSGGDTIIVLHGLLGSKKNWQSMSRKIAKETKNTVVAVDARNHGESPHVGSHTYVELASDVNQLITKLSLKQATIIGHSMGGRTAMVLALNEPSKVKKLVAVDISPVSTPGILNNFFPRLIDVMKTVKFEPNTDIGTARVSTKKQLQSSGLVDDISTLSFIMLNVGKRPDNQIGWMCNLDVLKKSFDQISTFPSEMAGKQYPGPTLFIAGDQSNYVPPSDITGIQGYFPKAQLKFVPNVGHNVHAEDPSMFFSMVATFLSEK